jgi:hypothetical protein
MILPFTDDPASKLEIEAAEWAQAAGVLHAGRRVI